MDIRKKPQRSGRRERMGDPYRREEQSDDAIQIRAEDTGSPGFARNEGLAILS
jgi:hypothetical protein